MRGSVSRMLGAAAVVIAMVHGGASAADIAPLPPLGNIAFNKDASSRVLLASDFSASAAMTVGAPNYGPPKARILTRREAAVSVALGSAVTLDLAYNADMAGRGGIYSSKAAMGSDGLFFSGGALNSPYASVVNGANYAGLSFVLADDVKLRVGTASLSPGRDTHVNDPLSTLIALDGNMPAYEMRRADAVMAGLNWDFASWGGLGVVALQTKERSLAADPLGFNGSATTRSLGFSASVGFGDGWVGTASFSAGLSNFESKSPLQFGETTERSRSYGLAIAKHGLFGTDSSLGLSVSRPLQNSWAAGSAARPLFFGRANLLENNIEETDIEVGYVTSFMDGALALQTNAAYQINAGKNGNDSVSLLSRAKIKF